MSGWKIVINSSTSCVSQARVSRFTISSISCWIFDISVSRGPREGKIAWESNQYAHAQECVKTLKDATGLSGGGSRWLLRKSSEDVSLDATGRGPWRFTFAANWVALQQIARNVRLHRARRWHLTRVHCWSFLAANVNLPRASRGHPSAVFTHL